jgi:urate oxidase
MTLVLTHGTFGESAIRILRLMPKGDRHEVRDLTVRFLLQGDFERGFTEGETLPLEHEQAIANRVYALAHEHCGDQIEPFALILVQHVLRFFPRVTDAEVEISEQLWSRALVGGRPHDRAFSATGEHRLARVRNTSDSTVVEAGFAGLPILKISPQENGGHAVLAGSLSARWRYGWADVPFGLHWQQVRQILMETFANHAATSVQQLLHAMAQAALDQTPSISEVRFTLQVTRMHAADLAHAGMESDPDLLIPEEGPFGIIEVSVLREV